LLNIRSSTAIILLAIATLAGCSSQQPATDNTKKQQATVKLDPATFATLSGIVHFSGTVPKAKRINMSEDPACKGQNEDESLVVRDGRLANVVVYVKSGLPNTGWIKFTRFARRSDEDPDPTSGIILQKGCRYVPHVVAVTTAEKVRIENDDPTTHNIHPMPRANKEWNASQSPGAEPLVKTFDHPELMIPVKCNVHPWMRAYINVFNHPFYRVTREDGTFSFNDLPPGTYTIAAVHETLGEQTAQVTVGPKQKKDVDFTFNSSPNPASAAK
jgi:hypothetical protein